MVGVVVVVVVVVGVVVVVVVGGGAVPEGEVEEMGEEERETSAVERDKNGHTSNWCPPTHELQAHQVVW